MLIFLAGLQGVPQELYDAAVVDGPGIWAKFRNVTLPMLTPTIFFQYGSWNYRRIKSLFSRIRRHPGRGCLPTWFYALHIYTRAFQYFEMGYASALAWIFFFVLFVFTFVQFRQSRRWVYYAGEVD